MNNNDKWRRDQKINKVRVHGRPVMTTGDEAEATVPRTAKESNN